MLEHLANIANIISGFTGFFNFVTVIIIAIIQYKNYSKEQRFLKLKDNDIVVADFKIFCQDGVRISNLHRWMNLSSPLYNKFSKHMETYFTNRNIECLFNAVMDLESTYNKEDIQKWKNDTTW